MPAELIERARALAAGETTWTPPVARPASTVVLLRDTDQGVSTFLMRRTSTMAFAAGMHVFPGGRIDDVDLQVEIDFVGELPDPARMTAEADLARGLIIGAVREVFEETGVLLAVDDSGRAPRVDDAWESDRQEVLRDSSHLVQVLRKRNLAIDAGLLPLWGHWITPEVEERRYDVRFFAAVVPEGHEVRDVSGEADRVLWVRPDQALADYAAGTLAMLPPTAVTLEELVHLPSTEYLAEQAAARDIRPLMPRARMSDDGTLVWELTNMRDGSVVWPLTEAPAGSESRGLRTDGPA
jgi:8-oxo-dGTP pyrophosphatase MutT (NUDIX family)